MPEGAGRSFEATCCCHPGRLAGVSASPSVVRRPSNHRTIVEPPNHRPSNEFPPRMTLSAFAPVASNCSSGGRGSTQPSTVGWKPPSRSGGRIAKTSPCVAGGAGPEQDKRHARWPQTTVVQWGAGGRCNGRGPGQPPGRSPAAACARPSAAPLAACAHLQWSPPRGSKRAGPSPCSGGAARRRCGGRRCRSTW